jgi:hypothetical protein
MFSFNSFVEKIRKIPVIDTHEHITAEKYSINSPIDVFTLFTPYICDNLLTCGMSVDEWRKLNDKSLNFHDRWEIFEPYYEYVECTTYFRAFLEVVKEVYGESEFNEESAERISKLLQEEVKMPYYSKYMDMCNIKKMMTFMPYDALEHFRGQELLLVPTVSDICPRSIEDINKLSKETNIQIQGIQDLKEAVRQIFNKYKENDIKAVKFGLAYHRNLEFDVVTDEEAGSTLRDILRGYDRGDDFMMSRKKPMASWEEVRALEDYLTNYMISLATEYDMPVVFHVGIHAWNWNEIDSCHAAYLNKLFFRFPSTKFVILHAGIPFTDEATLLCKYFPNVYLNMTWMHIIDREKSKSAMKQYIEMLPLNKIMAFGGDYCAVQSIYGHLKFAIENLSEVLYEYIEKGVMTEEKALNIAHLWLYENPCKIYKLK